MISLPGFGADIRPIFGPKIPLNCHPVRDVGVHHPRWDEPQLDCLRALAEAADVGGVQRVGVDVEVEVVAAAPAASNRLKSSVLLT